MCVWGLITLEHQVLLSGNWQHVYMSLWVSHCLSLSLSLSSSLPALLFPSMQAEMAT